MVAPARGEFGLPIASGLFTLCRTDVNPSICRASWLTLVRANYSIREEKSRSDGAAFRRVSLADAAAEVCRSCNIEFIGPPHEAMRRLGNKNEARKMAQAAGVPMTKSPKCGATGAILVIAIQSSTSSRMRPVPRGMALRFERG